MTASDYTASFFFSKAIRDFWSARRRQASQQRNRGSADQGSRSAVTGGQQMDGFARAIIDVLTATGVPDDQIHTSRMATHIPGFFRASKAWDILVVQDDALIAAIELKSQVGSFGNNFNNRTEEAMGTALDTWTAWREGAYRSGQSSVPPFLGYLLLVEDSTESRRPVRTYQPHFGVRAEFNQASYVDRYELFCRKLVIERQYSSACLIVADQKKANRKANYAEPAQDLSAAQFMSALVRHCAP